MADTTFGLTKMAVEDIQKVFNGPTHIHNNLGTSNKVWEPKIVARCGVKEVTARQLAREFLKVLREVHENVDARRGVDREVARFHYVKYRDQIERGLDTTDMVERVMEPTADKGGGMTSVVTPFPQERSTG